MGRRRTLSFIILTAGAVFAALALWTRGPATAAKAGAEAVGPASPSRWASTVPVAAASASASIAGHVRGPPSDLGASVFAIEDPLSSLSDQPCECVQGCTELLIDCGCAWALERLSEELQAHEQVQPRRFEGVLDSTGGFFTPVPEGRFTLWARQGKGVAALGKVASGTQGVELRLQPAVMLHGRVVGPGGEGVAGARVVAVHDSVVVRAVSGQDGQVELEGVPDGRWEAVALAPGLLGAKGVFLGSRYPASLELSLPMHVDGSVLREGRPVAGAAVALHRGHHVIRTTTDQLGAFAFERLLPGPVRLTVFGGGQCASATVETLSTGQRKPVRLTLGTCQTTVGTVTSVEGKRLAGALVSIGDGRRARETTRTGPEGSFRFLEVPKTWDRLGVELEGFERIEELRPELAGGTLSIVLRRAAAARGTVRDALDARPVAGAAIHLLDPRNAHQRLETTTTAEDGAFRFTGVPAGDVVLEVDDDRYLPLRMLVSLPNEALQVRVDPGTALEGRVVDPRGVPCARARFELNRGGFSLETGLDGRFRFSGLQPGRNLIEVSPPPEMAALPASTELMVGGERVVNLDFHLSASALLSGTLLDEDSRPVAGASVKALGVGKEAGDRSATRPSGYAQSAVDGTFALQQLPAGSYYLTVSADSFDSLRTTVRTGDPLTLRLTRDRSWALLRGRFLSPEGAPVTDFEVWTHPRHAEDGRFEERFRPKPGDSFEVTAKGYAPWSRPISAKPGETLDLGDLVLSRGVTVSGTVVEAESLRALEGAVVVVGDPTSLGEILESSQSPNAGILEWLSSQQRVSADGAFRFEHVDEKSTHLFVFERNHRPELLPLPADRENVRVVLGRGAEIRGTVKDPEPGAAAKTIGWVRTAQPKMVMHIDYLTPEEPRRVRLDDSGAFRVSGLAPGLYQVTAERLGDASVVYTKTEVEVAADGVATAVVSRRQGLDLMLRVFDADGAAARHVYAQIVPGEVALPKSAAERAQLNKMSDWAVELREGHGFPALAPGRHTLFVATGLLEKVQRVRREVVDVAHDRQLVEVRLTRELPVFVSAGK